MTTYISSNPTPAADKSLTSKELPSITAPSTSTASTDAKKEESKETDVSFNTLLNDSNLSFDPIKDEKEEAKIASRKSILGPKDKAALQEITMKLSEVENAYEHYREKTDLELIELREKLESYEENKASEDELRNQIMAQKFQVAEKQEEIDKLKEQHKKELDKVQDEVLALQGQLQVKDHFIMELEKQNDEFQGKLEKTGFDVFMQIKSQLFAETTSDPSKNEELRKEVHNYDKIENEITQMMEKYSKRELEISRLQVEN